MTKDEALKMCLEYIETDAHERKYVRHAIKEALAQPEQDGECKHCTDGCPACDTRKLPEQEPVAWAKFSAKGNIIDLLSEPDDDYTPLYTTPPQRTWVGLTEDEQTRLFTDWDEDEGWGPFIEAIEAKLKEKNNG
jgi:hypothetical protein